MGAIQPSATIAPVFLGPQTSPAPTRRSLLTARWLVLTLACAAMGCSSPVVMVSRAPDKAGVAEWELALEKVRTIELRAGQAKTATISHKGERGKLVLRGRLEGGAEGYHPAPDLYEKPWKETPPTKWGLGFEARRFGPRLVVSSRNEIVYIHHHYMISEIEVIAPPEVRVKLVDRELDGEGASDLSFW
jgi:hypothetical protein